MPPCPDCRRGFPCGTCLAHGDDLSTVLIANQLPVHLRNEGRQERVQRAVLWLIDETLNEYEGART